MHQRKFYHPNFQKGYFGSQDQKKKEFVAFRIESNKLIELKNKAQELRMDLSEFIRKRLENV